MFFKATSKTRLRLRVLSSNISPVPIIGITFTMNQKVFLKLKLFNEKINIKQSQVRNDLMGKTDNERLIEKTSKSILKQIWKEIDKLRNQ